MAQLVAFHFQPRVTPVHRLDPRFKLPLFLLLIAVILHSSPLGLGLLTGTLVVTAVLSRLPIGRIAHDLRLFALLLLLMFVVRSFADPLGPYLSIGPLNLPREGTASAALLVWRLTLLLLYGTLFAATTRSSRLQAAVAWYLKPFRFLPGARIATMVGLTISLIPLIFDSFNEIVEAQRARCSQGMRNPLRRLRDLAVPLILKTFGRADTLASAIESRCYSDRRSFGRLDSRPSDWLAAAVVALVAAAALAIDHFV